MSAKVFLSAKTAAPDAGNLLQNGAVFTYDAEGRVATMNGQTSYIYDAEGRRVAKMSGSTVQNQYLLGLGGEQVSEVDGQNRWLHTNAYAGGRLLGTYDLNGVHFHFTDWLGTRRVQASAAGLIEQSCVSLPFGDGLNCVGADVTEQHFTGKERDSESGLDNFDFRYYGSNMGRFMSPDPSSLYFADPANPQSLNLYSYVRNNPLINTDPTGLDCVYINNDTGAYQGSNRGDCDNSTDAKANTGHYFDGTLTTLYTSDGTLQGQVTGFGGTNDSGTNLFVNNPAGLNSGQGQSTNLSMDALTWASGQNTPPSGAWTYGNWAGPGGRGVPIDGVDTGAMLHDYCYYKGGYSAGSNFKRNQPAGLQGCNQALVDTAAAIADQLFAKSNATGDINRMDRSSPGGNLTGAERAEWQAAKDIVTYFSLVPFGNAARNH